MEAGFENLFQGLQHDEIDRMENLMRRTMSLLGRHLKRHQLGYA